MTVLRHEPVIVEGDVEPGSARWMQLMTASKIAAVLGLSPWESRYSLWHRMAGRVPAEKANANTRRGHYLEPGIRRWFEDEHPELLVVHGSMYAHPERTWQAATPDGLCFSIDDVGPVAALEIKTSGSYDEDWGVPGTDEIPVYYRAQTIWQLDVLGLDRCHVAVLSSGLRLAEYVVEYDADEAAFMRQEAQAFMATLPGGVAEEVPDIDAHSATYDIVKQLPDGVVAEAVDIPLDLVDRYRVAQDAFEAAEQEKRLTTSLVLDAIGDRRWADCDGQRVFTRAVKRTGGTHSLTYKRTTKETAS